MRDLTDELARYGEAVEQAVAPVSVPDQPRMRSRRWRRPALAALAAVLVLVPLAAALWLRGDRSDRPADDFLADEHESFSLGDKYEPGWNLLPPAPPGIPDGVAMAATNTEVVFWPEDWTAAPAGAAFDVRTRQWRAIAPSPGGAGSVSAVWTGSEILVVSDTDREGQPAALHGYAWDPTTDTWRLIQDSPAPQQRSDPSAPVWTGRLVVFAGHGLAYDPERDTWRTLAAPLEDGKVIGSARLGDEIVVVRTAETPTLESVRGVWAAAYDPERDTWRKLGPPPIGSIGFSLVAVGEDLLAIDYEMQTATIGPGDRDWRPADPLPFRFYEGLPTAAPVAERALVVRWPSFGLFDPEYGWSISPLPAAEDGQSAPINRLVEVDGFVATGPTQDAAIFATFPAGDLSPTSSIPVGTVVLDLPDGASLIASDWAESGGGLVTTLGFDLELGDGTPCRLTSTYSGALGNPEATLRQEAEDHDGTLMRFAIGALPGGTETGAVGATFAPGARSEQAHVLIVETTSDTLEITCDDLATASLLASNIRRPG